MRKRKNELLLWLDDKEMEHLKKAISRTGLSKQEYLRQLINGYVPKDLPPPEFRDILTELYKIAEMYRILVTAAVAHKLDTRELQEQYKSLCKAIEEITIMCYRAQPIKEAK